MLLYKYTTSTIANKIISNHEIRFTQPGSLNDLFEMTPIFKNNIKNELFSELFNKAIDTGEIESVLNKSISDSYEKLEDNSKKYFSQNEYKDFLINYMNHILRKENKNLTEFVLERFRKIDIHSDFRVNWINFLNSYIGILCLSETFDVELMWINYSENHKGIVLEFDTDHHFFSPIYKVNYESEIPSIDLSELNEIDKNPFKYLGIVKTKSPHWSYEKEHRIFKLLNQKDRIDSDLDSLKFQIYLFKFPPRSLKGIIFGLRWTEELIEDFKKNIVFDLYRNLNLYRMSLSYDTRTLTRETISI